MSRGRLNRGGTLIRKARREDVPFCHELTVIEDWNFSLEEISVMAALKSANLFVAEDEKDGNRVGTVASFQCGRSAWIGNLIVLEEYRGRGVGTSLMEKALIDLESKGVAAVRLEAVHEAVSMYERLGFNPEFESLRLHRIFHGGKRRELFSEKVFSEGMLKEISVFDEKYFGVNREELLNGFFKLSPVRLMEKTTLLKGYLLARTAPAKIGPSVCEDGEVFESLLSSALSHLEGTVSVGVPECNKEGVSILEQYGFTLTGSSLRMVRGKGFTGAPEKICAIGGPNKG